MATFITLTTLTEGRGIEVNADHIAQIVDSVDGAGAALGAGLIWADSQREPTRVQQDRTQIRKLIALASVQSISVIEFDAVAAVRNVNPGGGLGR